jgi:glycosyltransferase involved in cell wall biosynthesis
MKTLILGPVLWDSIWGHGQELTRILSKEHKVTYLEPIVHSSNLSLSFQRTTTNPIPKKVRIIRRETNFGLNVIYGIYCEFKNLYNLMGQDYDIFITYYTTCGFLATLFSRLIGKKVILMYVDDLSEWYEPKIAKILTKYVFTPLVIKCSNVTVTTAHKLEEFAYGYNKHVEYIPNGVNLSSFQECEISSDNKMFVIGFIGSFGSRINYDMIIETATLLKNDKNIKFLFAGGGEGFDYFNRIINELNLDNIRLLGVVPHSEVPQLLSEMDVCIIPFKINQLTDCISPVKLFEYWAMGKPVISTSCYEIKKIANGKVMFADNPEEFKDIILTLKNNRKIQKKYVDMGLEEVKKYDWDVLGEKYLKIITGLK